MSHAARYTEALVFGPANRGQIIRICLRSQLSLLESQHTQRSLRSAARVRKALENIAERPGRLCPEDVITCIEALDWALVVKRHKPQSSEAIREMKEDLLSLRLKERMDLIHLVREVAHA